ncbi:anti-sigma factor [Oleiagrimonas sp.]|jgi:anti-sigma-K factor RskA|uniref:anti-sigma factor n=1 Tax=Oleiagrimonas sp. TaxID=2010330 RepID=UPI002604997B|nr:anti-sigma factor [Oleiagrimonas sp.]MDA3913968.1 anti-sigma factor [Oleiagrimonas sp.]
MNTTTDHDGHEKLRGAEYALGVLDAAQRRQIEQQMQDDPELADAVAGWHKRLTPLAEEIAPVEPAPYVWARIVSELGLHPDRQDARIARPTQGGFWNNLRLWHWIGIGASGLAAACLVLLFTIPRAPQPAAPVTAPAARYLVAQIKQDNGVAGWTATVDVGHKSMIVIPATPAAVTSGKSTQLWLIPPGHKPISLGLIARDKSTRVTLDPALLAQLGHKALLAVSVEPPGGSPTGQPTGPVIAKGSINGA